MRKRKKRLFLASLLAMVFLAFLVPGIALASDTEVNSPSALKNAINNGTTVSVKLTGDIDMKTEIMAKNSNLNIADGKTVTIDLNGHTLSGSAQNVITVVSGGNLTVVDNSADQDGAIKSNNTTTNNSKTITVNGVLNLESGYILTSDQTEKKLTYAVYVNSGQLNMTGGTILAQGKGESNCAISIGGSNKNISTISDGNVLVTQNGHRNNGLSGAKPTNLSISGGTFSFDPALYCVEQKTSYLNANETYTIVELTKDNAAAMIGDTPYATLYKAGMEANDGAMINVLKNIEEYAACTISSKNVVLNLNDHTVRLLGTGNFMTIADDADLTIQAGSEGRGQIISEEAYAFYVKGKLTLKSGTIETIAIRTAVSVESTGTFVLENGTVSGSPAISAKGTVELKSGNVNVVNDPYNYGALRITDSDANVTIGDISSTASSVSIDKLSIDKGVTPTIILLSGTIGSVYGTLPVSDADSIGCVFGMDITDNLKENLICVETEPGSGKYMVKAIGESDFAAIIISSDGKTEKKFGSVEQAVANLDAGETLKLYTDYHVTQNSAAIDLKVPNVTLDLNGHHVSVVPESETTNITYGVSLSGCLSDTFKIINTSDSQASITGYNAAVRATTSNNNTTVIVSIEGDIKLIATKPDVSTVNLGHAAMAYSDDAAVAISNGGFINEKKDYIYGIFAEALNASDTNEVTLLNDYSGGQYLAYSSETDPVILNLNGHKYNYNGDLGTLYLTTDNLNLTVKNGTLSSSDVGVVILGNNISLTLDDVNVVANGESYGVFANGSFKSNDLTLKNGTSVTAEKGTGIYWPGNEGSVSIDNSSVTGLVGVQICAGDLTISGEDTVITALGNPEPKTEDDGTIWDGAAVSIINRDGYGEMGTVTINGGSFVAKGTNGNNTAVNPVKTYTFNNTDRTEGAWENVGDKVTVNGGNYSQPVNKNILSDSLTTEYYSAQNTATPYSYFGSTDEAVKNLQPGDKVTSLNSGTGTTTDNKTVTISYGNGSADTVLNLPAETTVNLPAAPSRNGYTFGGWTDGTNTYQAGAEITIGDAEKYTAIWTVIPGSPAPDVNYPVTIPNDLDNGSITIPQQDKWATDGEKITITVTPDAGYMLDDLTITDGNGNKITYTDNGDGTYTFTMPGSGVSIDTTFVVDPDYEEPSDEPTDPDTPTDVADIFIDVKAGAWYENAIQFCVDNGLMTGTSDITFEPQTPTTRGMIVSILHRLEGAPAASGNDFSDVNDGEWYSDPVSWAAANGIVGGYTDGTFQPNRVITREEMASILYRYCEYKGINVSARADLDRYTDSPSEWAAEVMSWANAEGLINGRTATTIDAKDSTTRAECAAIFQRYVENVVE